MTIRPALIQELSVPNVLLLSANQTMNEVVAQLLSRGLPEASTYVVVTHPDGRYQVGATTDLARIVALTGPDGFALPLAELPVAPAGEVIRQDTPVAGGAIRDRVKASPNKTFVIVNDQGFVALFVNPTRGGMDLASSSLLRIHGELAPLGPGAALPSTVTPPVCPHCRNRGWYWFSAGHYTCQACHQIVEAP